MHSKTLLPATFATLRTLATLWILSLCIPAAPQLRADDPVLPIGADQIREGIQIGNSYEVTAKDGTVYSGFVIPAGEGGGLSITVPDNGPSIISVAGPGYKFTYGN